MRINKMNIGFLITVLLFMATNITLAQFQPGGAQSVPGQQIVCRGARDYSTFLSATLSYDSFKEYWKDILVRYNTNICLYQDIDNLLNRIEKVRKQIRSAFYACADTTRMKRTYYELEAELFFLRNYINVDGGNFLVKNDQILLENMRDYFVLNKNFFTDQEIIDLHQKFIDKYSVRMETYRDCKDPTWQNLVDKWNEFRETGAGVGPALQQARERTEEAWDRMANTSMDLGRKFIGGFVDVKVNGLTPKEGFQQIKDELLNNLPNLGSGNNPTIEQIQLTSGVASDAYQLAQQEILYLSEYQALYGETSDVFTKQIVENLIDLKTVIDSSFKYENQTIDCIRSVNAKQC